MASSLKKLLLYDENWYRYRHFYSEIWRYLPSVGYNINKIIICRYYARGHACYRRSVRGEYHQPT
jgi:hypothetical protein